MSSTPRRSSRPKVRSPPSPPRPIAGQRYPQRISYAFAKGIKPPPTSPRLRKRLFVAERVKSVLADISLYDPMVTGTFDAFSENDDIMESKLLKYPGMPQRAFDHCFRRCRSVPCRMDFSAIRSPILMGIPWTWLLHDFFTLSVPPMLPGLSYLVRAVFDAGKRQPVINVYRQQAVSGSIFICFKASAAWLSGTAT